jgi:hypothetical protein
MRPTSTRLAAFAAALIIVCQSGAATQAQTASNPQPYPKPSAQVPAKPKAQTAPKQSAAQPAPSGKSVCVASVIGQKFDVQKIGIMVFGNSLDKVAIDSWGVDDLAVRKIQDVVGRNYAVRRLPVSASALTLLEPKPFSGWVKDPMHDFLTAVAGTGPRCAMYMTVTRAASQYAGTNQHVAGLGIFNHESPIFDRTHVFASFVVRAFDGETLKPLRSEKPTTDPIAVTALTGGVSAMNRRVDKTWMPAPPQSAAQNAQLRSTTRALVEEGMAKATRTIFEGP